MFGYSEQQWSRHSPTRQNASRSRAYWKRFSIELSRGFIPIEWLIATLHQRSFFFLMSFFALLATSPGRLIGAPALFSSWQLRSSGAAASRLSQTHHHPSPADAMLLSVGQHAIAVLKWLEKLVLSALAHAFETTKPATGIIVLLLSCAILLTPVPLSNVAPAALIVVIALASIEEDGLFLAVSLAGAITASSAPS